jgi:hypothetical protein
VFGGKRARKRVWSVARKAKERRREMEVLSVITRKVRPPAVGEAGGYSVGEAAM